MRTGKWSFLMGLPNRWPARATPSFSSGLAVRAVCEEYMEAVQYGFGDCHRACPITVNEREVFAYMAGNLVVPQQMPA